MSTLFADLRTLSYEATVYLYPLVVMDVTRRQSLHAPGVGGPANEFRHIREFPSADFRFVVRPNFDTLYSIAWLDLSGGPVTVHAPDTDDRYYMLPMLDMWTDVFANPGQRTTGTAAQDFLVVGPEYDGTMPTDATVIVAPTPHVWIIGRTQTNGPADYANVHAVQDGYTVAAHGDRAEPADDADRIDIGTEPLRLVDAMAPLDFFGCAAELLAVNPPHPTDFSVLARIAGLGIVPGKPFDAKRFDADERAEIEAGRAAALGDVRSSVATLGTDANGWRVMTDTVGVYGNAYLRRAAVAMMGLGANPPEDAVYPVLAVDADGDPVTGDRDYVLHFDADGLPPVSAFWSVTMYDAEGYQVANELGRFALGDRDPLAYNDDGSLDLYIQRANPGPQRLSNWLPAAAGPLGITMRLYAPQRGILDGSWTPPPLVKAQ